MTEGRNPNLDQLEYVLGPESVPQRVPLKFFMLIGQASDTDLTLSDPQISGHHLEIRLEGKGYTVTDLASQTGSYLDNTRLTPGQSYLWRPDKGLRLGSNCWLHLILEDQSLDLPQQYFAIRNLKLEPAEIGQGDTTQLSFTLANTGGEADVYRLSVKGIPKEAMLTYAPPQNAPLQLAPGQERPIRVTITLPELRESAAGSYLLKVQVESERYQDRVAIKTEMLRVKAYYDLECQLKPKEIRSIAQGESTLELHNKGNTSLAVTFQPQDAEQQCLYSVTPDEIQIPPFQRRFVKIGIKTKGWLPRDGNRVHPFFVTVRPDQGQSRQVEGLWEQVHPSFGLQVQPEIQKGQKQGNFKISVVNGSEADLRLTFAGKDERGRCRYTFEPLELLVSAGGQEEVDLTLQPLVRRRWWQGRAIFAFTIRSWPVEAETFAKEAQGQWVQLPTPFNWKLLLLWLIPLLICTTTSWQIYPFLLRQPHIDEFGAEPEQAKSERDEIALVYEVDYKDEGLLKNSLAHWLDYESVVTLSRSDGRDVPVDLPLEATQIVTVSDTTVFTLTAAKVNLFKNYLLDNNLEDSQSLVVTFVAPTPTPSPTPTPTSTSTPTDTPTPTATPNPTNTPSPTPTDTPTFMATPFPPGVFHDFETPAWWDVGDRQPYGTLISSTEQFYNGRHSGQLNYEFSNRGPNNDSTDHNDYVIFELRPQVALAGQPTQISAWVLGDGSGHYLNVWIRDSAGETWQFPLGQIWHTGWRQMIANLANQTQGWPRDHIDGPGNDVVDYPIRFRALVLDDVPDAFTGASSLYIDDLASGTVTEVVVPTPTPTPTLNYEFTPIPCLPHDTGSPGETRLTAWIVQATKPGSYMSLPGYQLKVIAPDGVEHLSPARSDPTYGDSTQGGDNHRTNLKIEISPYTAGLYRVFLVQDNRQVSPEVPVTFGAEPRQYRHIYFIKGAFKPEDFCLP